jgi:SAM-dependent methyltransferase
MRTHADALPDDFLGKLRELEESYLSVDDPIRQSGFGGGPERWRTERAVILEAVDQDGDFLDVGCANGHLLECLVTWAAERGFALTPYGVDFGPRLIELAKQRLPQYASHFWVANAWDWRPPRRFRYVYSLCDCVPEGSFCEYVRRLVERFVEEDGTLIIGAYGSYGRDEPAGDVAGALRDCGFTVAGSAGVGSLPATRVAWVRARSPVS